MCFVMKYFQDIAPDDSYQINFFTISNGKAVKVTLPAGATFLVRPSERVLTGLRIELSVQINRFYTPGSASPIKVASGMLCTLQTRIFDSREDYLSNEPFFVENLHSREILHIYSAALNYKM